VFKTWRALRGEAADVLHAHYAFPDGVVGVAVARAKGIPCVVTLHGTDANRQMKRRLVGPLIARAIGRADRIVCVSNRMESELRNAFPRLADRLATVKNGYSPDFIYFQKKPSADYFLFVGNLEPVKNPDILIEAFARIADHTKRDLLVVGDGPMADEIARMADRLGVSGRVRMAGTLLRPDLREAYRSAVALVLPSRSEGMPIVVSESLATGTPVVASDVGGISELVTSDRLGILVPPNDVEALAAGMLAADTREWDEEEIAREAPIVSWADNAERVVALYHQVAVPAKSAGGKHA
jgi:glycosyltransferase involved in cell wall biosynthesis